VVDEDGSEVADGARDTRPRDQWRGERHGGEGDVASLQETRTWAQEKLARRSADAVDSGGEAELGHAGGVERRRLASRDDEERRQQEGVGESGGAAGGSQKG
jgi:hypothetical protein